PIPLLQNQIEVFDSSTSQKPNIEISPLSTQTYVPVGDLIQLDNALLSPIQNIFSDKVSLNLPQNDIKWFDNIEDRYNASTDEKWSELARSLFYDYPKKIS
ncbi:4758_t:CDS:1, partial [Racocetra persica]